MTNDNGVPSGHRRQTRHRLTDRDRLAEQLTRHWGDRGEVAAYVLTVRDLVEQHADIGPVDTWRWAALEIACAQARPQGEQAVCRARKDEGNLRRLRKKLSWNFGVRSRGPRWPLVELLVQHLVPAGEQEATRSRLADLYRAARGRYPKGYAPEPVEAPAPGSGETDPVELPEREKAELRAQLYASRAENLRLRADLAELTGRLWQAESPSDEVDDEKCLPSSRTTRNEGHFGHLTRLDEDPPVRRKPSRVDMVAPRSSGTAGVAFWMAEFRHGGLRNTAGPVDRHTPSPPTDRFPQPGTGRIPAPNTVWRRPPG
ncbi:hypothetical protein ACIBJE_18975 [Micromonospora sp. NPDC050187]|uniref:hypothetical protein n=1 Tax=Micromonospora sp. NPDC050187 TaxID=3364277 RepID=UPI0037B05A21